jgi:hypothetical protein
MLPRVCTLLLVATLTTACNQVDYETVAAVTDARGDRIEVLAGVSGPYGSVEMIQLHIRKTSKQGDELWWRSFGGKIAGNAYPHSYGEVSGGALALAPDGSVTVSGSVNGAVDFETGIVGQEGAVTGFLLHLDGDGKVVWSHSAVRLQTYLATTFEEGFSVGPGGEVVELTGSFDSVDVDLGAGGFKLDRGAIVGLGADGLPRFVVPLDGASFLGMLAAIEVDSAGEIWAAVPFEQHLAVAGHEVLSSRAVGVVHLAADGSLLELRVATSSADALAAVVAHRRTP